MYPVSNIPNLMSKYIFVTGGVTSSLGKGIVSASLGKLLSARGYSVTIQKFDPYINVDPGTLNPYEHGECYVTEDGAETDLDLGHYERFLNKPMSKRNNVTTGKIYQTVINKEREGAYLGKTVQVVPHITDEIQRRMMLLGENDDYDIIITEIGGTVGDIESQPFLEAFRQLRWKLGKSNCINIHLTLIPFLETSGELKTKPTQHSVKELLENGIQPDILVCRTHYRLTKDVKRKIALFCNVKINAVIEAIDLPNIYEVPLVLHEEELDKIVLSKFKLSGGKEPDLEDWKSFVNQIKCPQFEVNIGLIGKYVELHDAYKSIHESFIHAGAVNKCKVNIHYIQSDNLTRENTIKHLKNLDAVLVAPGFGYRGVEGKLEGIRYVREHNIPFFGICLGMQCAVVEIARNVLNYKNANSTEMDRNSSYPVIDLMEDQKMIVKKGGTMRLGAYKCGLEEESKVAKIYQSLKISERHRHRYEFNNDYLADFEKIGFNATGINPGSKLVEIMELQNHPWFIGVQFHPELKSTVANPHPLFVSFVKAAMDYHNSKKATKESRSAKLLPNA